MIVITNKMIRSYGPKSQFQHLIPDDDEPFSPTEFMKVVMREYCPECMTSPCIGGEHTD